MTVAWAVLLLWPVAAYAFYRNLSLPKALCVTFIGGYLLLPSDVWMNLPALPALNKSTIPTLTALLLTAIFIRQTPQPQGVLPGWLPRNVVVLGLLGVLMVGVLGTAATNTDFLNYGGRVLQRLGVYDVFSMYLELVVFLLIPLFLGRRVLASREGQRVLLLTLAVSALIYSLPTLFEIRMSPQLHMQVYGFFQASFAQHIRGDGFRPVVFLGHGLALSIFLGMACIATLGLFRTAQGTARLKWLLATGWLFATLVLSKSLGALLITMVLLPVVFFLTPRMQMMAAACVSIVVLAFPLLRATDTIPVERVVAFAESIDEARVSSLKTRLFNEENILEKASQRPVFGWGGWGRSRVFDEEGRNITITDGAWIMELGFGGWFRYLAIFGLLCWPAIGLLLQRRTKVDQVCATLAVLLSAKLIDVLPNSDHWVPIFWLIAGALVGRLEIRADAPEDVPQAAQETGPVRAYARGFQKGDRPPGPAYARAFPKTNARQQTEKKRQPPKQYTRGAPTLGYRK